MKPREQGGIVDSRFNVYGIRCLKLVHLPVCTPGKVAVNTYSTVLTICEKVIEII